MLFAESIQSKELNQDQEHPSSILPCFAREEAEHYAGSSGINALSNREMQSFNHNLRFFRRLMDSSSA